MTKSSGSVLVALALGLVGMWVGAAPAFAQQPAANMNFFVMPTGATFGANQGAVAVGDQHCHTTAYAAGRGDFIWKVYLDGKAAEGEAGEVARNRIGSGPWYNYYGELIAENVAQLHSDANNLSIDTAVTIEGEYLEPSVLRIPPGSQLGGAAFTRAGPYFCFGTPE